MAAPLSSNNVYSKPDPRDFYDKRTYEKALDMWKHQYTLYPGMVQQVLPSIVEERLSPTPFLNKKLLLCK